MSILYINCFNDMKIAFFGTSAFGEAPLRALHQHFGVEFVVTAPAKPAKRGQKLQNTPIFETAQQLGINRIYTPETLTNEIQQHLTEIDYGVVVSYGKILPSRILGAVKKRFLNLHPSMLPLFRGAAPIERTIEAGYTETEICIIGMQKELDAGNILSKQKYTINAEENSIDLHEKFSHIGAGLLVNLLQQGITTEEIQNHQNTTYAKKIEKSELELFPIENYPTLTVLNKIRAFANNGYCFLFYKGKRFKIIQAEISQVHKTFLDISCTDGFITPIIVRPEGKGNLSIKDLQAF